MHSRVHIMLFRSSIARELQKLGMPSLDLHFQGKVVLLSRVFVKNWSIYSQVLHSSSWITHFLLSSWLPASRLFLHLSSVSLNCPHTACLCTTWHTSLNPSCHSRFASGGWLPNWSFECYRLSPKEEERTDFALHLHLNLCLLQHWYFPYWMFWLKPVLDCLSLQTYSNPLDSLLWLLQ
jgi:hypothetical protein